MAAHFPVEGQRTNRPSNTTPENLRCEDGILGELDIHDAEVSSAGLRDNDVLFLEKPPQARPQPTMRNNGIVLDGNVVHEWWDGYTARNRMELLQPFSELWE